ncbi:MAG: hypothetical protein IJ719_03230 [Clostridia bacterium]|nr:hypothetical protein [Clostridia bacterium]
MERKKYGWTAKGIVGMIFTPIGLLFLPLGLLLWHVNVTGDPRDSLVFLIAFGGVGAVFLLLGLALLFADLRRRHLQRRAYEGGYYVMAHIARASVQRNVNLNGSNPLVIECHYTDPDTGIAHVYYSRYLYTDVTDLLTSDEVPVYIDRMDDRVGFVDIDAVLPKIQIHK